MDFKKAVDELPPKNAVVVAYCEGEKEHSGVLWKREGWALMVRHDGEWARHYYKEACSDLDCDWLDVVWWAELRKPSNASLSRGEAVGLTR